MFMRVGHAYQHQNDNEVSPLSTRFASLQQTTQPSVTPFAKPVSNARSAVRILLLPIPFLVVIGAVWAPLAA